MSDSCNSLLDPTIIAAVITVAGAVVTLLVGQMVIRFVLEPIIELRREIGLIAGNVDFYANQMTGDSQKGDEAREVFRKHACRLREILNITVCYDLIHGIWKMPSKKSVIRASMELIGHSNYPKKPNYDYDRRRDDNIKKFLNIDT